jgi:hypothetical protein
MMRTVDTPDILVCASLDRRSEHEDQAPDRDRVLRSGLNQAGRALARATLVQPRSETYLSGDDVGDGTSNESTDESAELKNSREQSEGLRASEVGVRTVQLEVSDLMQRAGIGETAYDIAVTVHEALHDLHLTEDTLVVAVQDTSERCEHGDGDDFAVLEETAPSLVLRLREDGVEVASCGCSSAHDDDVVVVVVVEVLG